MELEECNIMSVKIFVFWLICFIFATKSVKEVTFYYLGAH